jgi:hypothetical protein
MTDKRVLAVSGTREPISARMLLHLRAVLDLELKEYPNLKVLVGDATGIDAAVRQWCADHDVPCQVFIANWKKYGHAAGPIRNATMLDEHPHALYCFHTDPQLGKGTKDCFHQAERRQIKTTIHLLGASTSVKGTYVDMSSADVKDPTTVKDPTEDHPD